MCAFHHSSFRRRSRRRIQRPAFGIGLEPLEQRLCLSVIPVASPALLDPQSIAQQLGAAHVSIASDSNGDFVATWDTSPNTLNTHIHAQRFNAQGQPVGNEIQVDNFGSGAGVQQDSSVAMDAAGNFTVVWQGFDSADDTSGIFMRQFPANGTPLSTSASPVQVGTLVDGVIVGDPQIAMDPSGAFVVAWTQPALDIDETEGVQAQRFNAQGVAQGAAFEINTFRNGDQFEPAVAMDPSGNFIIAWLSDGQNINGGIGVYAQRYKSGGQKTGSEFQAYTQLEGGQVDRPAVAFAPDASFIIASDSQTTDGTGSVFTVRRFKSSGSAEAAAQVITDAGLDAGTAVAFDSSGEALLARSSGGAVTGQLISPAGLLDGSPFTIYQAPTGFLSSALHPAITALPGNKFLIAFEGYVVPNVGTGVAAQEFASDAGQTPPPTDTFDYAKRVGGEIDDSGTKVVTDALGNVYVAGQIGINGASEVGTVVQKYTADGTLVWSKTFGPTGGDTTDFAIPAGLVVDSSGNIDVAGTFNSRTDFDPGSGTAARSPNVSGNDSSDSFILTLDPDGNFVRVTTLGGDGTADVEITAIGIDAADDLYATGAFNGDLTLGSDTLTTAAAPGNVLDGFLWKLDSTGVTQWALQLGNETTLTAITALAVDPAGNAYVTALAGFGDAVNFDPLGFGTDLGAAAFGTVVVAKYDPTGHLAWANGYDEAALATTLPMAIGVDAEGDVYAAGVFSSALSFNPGAIPTVPSGASANTFLLKLTSGGAFSWVRTIGGTAGTLTPSGIATDPNGNIFESGVLTGLINADPAPGAGLTLFSSNGGSASVISGFDASGDLISADLLGGGVNSVFVNGIAIDQTGRLYLTGSFTGAADLDPSTGTSTLTSAGGKDLFFAKFSPPSALPEPEISLTGNGVAILAGENAPATANATDFGTTTSGGGSTTHTFTIKNNGNADLHLGDLPVQITGADAGDFSVVTQPAATVAAGDTTTFTVQFAPTDVNTRTATLTIASDDPAHPEFTCEVQGLGLLGGDQPALAVTLSPTALPATVLPGEKIKVSFVVTNVGAVLAKSAVNLAFSFGTGDTLDPAVDVSLPGFSKSVNLAPGKSIPLTETFTVPAATQPAMVRLFVTPDADNVLNEGNQGSNTASSAQSDLVWMFGNVAGEKSVKLAIPNSLGVVTTFILSGNGNGQVIPGDGGAWDLLLTGTDAHSSVTVTTSGGKTTTIQDITDQQDLKSFVAKTTDVTGDVTFGGVISTLTLADATTGGQEIQIGNAAAPPVSPLVPVTIALGQASGLSLNSLSPIKALTAVEWLDPSATRDTIAAPSLGTLKITGNAKLHIAGDFDADVLLSDAMPKQTLATATIAGSLTDSVVLAAGNIGAITVGRLDHAGIFAGFAATPTGLPSQASDFTPFTLGTLTVRGVAGQTVSVVDSLIAAETISTITLKDVQLDNDQTPFGVAAESIKSYTRLVTGGQTVKLKSLHTATPNAEPGDTGDFVVRIVPPLSL